MSVHDEIIEKLNGLKAQAQNAHDQGRTPDVVPLTLKQGIDILGLLLVVHTYYNNHHHEITVNKQERETTGPK